MKRLSFALPFVAALLVLLAPGAARRQRWLSSPIIRSYVEDSVRAATTSQGCTGHDEPELDPVSILAASARD